MNSKEYINKLQLL